jgi:hypothetical protein
MVAQGSKQVWRAAAVQLEKRLIGVTVLQNGRLAVAELVEAEAMASEVAAAEGATARSATQRAVSSEAGTIGSLAARRLAGTKIPDPADIGMLLRTSARASRVATRIVDDTPVELLLYDSHGLPIIYANQTENYAVYQAATRAFRSETAVAVDEICGALETVAISSEIELPGAINSILSEQARKHSGRYIFDVGTGKLTFNVPFDSGSQIVGTVNVYSVVKRSVMVGAGAAGGYKIIKALEG